MKLLYLILAHRNPDQLKYLVESLSDEHSCIVIHIDKKSNLADFKAVLPGQENIFYVEDRQSVSWGGFSQVRATLALIKEAFTRKIDFEYANLISGQDVKIKSSEEIRAFFVHNRGRNFMDFTPMPFKQWAFNGGVDRVAYRWFVEQLGIKPARLLYHLQQILFFKRKLPAGITLYGGSQWWTLTKSALEYIMTEGGPDSPFYRRFGNTLCPDEVYFHTLMLNSPMAHTIERNSLRYIDWGSGPEYPKILRASDYEAIVQSGNLFARKVVDAPNELTQMLEQHYTSDHEEVF